MRKELNEVCRKALTREVLPDTAPVYPQEMIKRLAHLSRVVALLRGVVCRDRFTQKLDAKPTTEIGTRVVKQIAKLGKGIAIFHEVKEITPEIYQTLCAVARGTIPDLVEEIVRTMAVQINKGAATLSIPLLAEKTHLPQNTLRVMVDDLVLLHVCERAAPNGMQHNYRLTDTILNHINESGIFDRYLKTARLA
jgi:hypothetical protein